MEEMILHMWDASSLALCIESDGTIEHYEKHGDNNPPISNIYNHFTTYVNNITHIHAGFVATMDTGKEKFPVIGFRGTKGPADTINDLFANWSKFMDGTNVHSGFNAAINSLKDGILKNQIIRDAAVNKDTIYITGHSKGGAMAALMARVLSLTYPDCRLKVYTFGSPRVGGQDFASRYHADKNITHLRVESFGDMVPFVPFAENEFKLPNLYLNTIKKSLPMYEPQYVSVGNYYPVNTTSNRNPEKIAPAQSIIGTIHNDLNAFYVALADFNRDINIFGKKHTNYFPTYQENRLVNKN